MPYAPRRIQQAIASGKPLELEFYIYGEDLANSLTGPFPTREAAEAHLAKARQVFDTGTHHEVISELVATLLAPDVRTTPEEDLDYLRRCAAQL